MAGITAHTQVVGEQSHTCAEGIRVADQNDYSYSEFVEYKNAFYNNVFNRIFQNPKLIPYTPKFVKRDELPDICTEDTYFGFPEEYVDCKKEYIFAMAQYFYYIFGVESSYAYSHNYKRIVLQVNHLCPNFDHPITRKWFLGE